VKLLALAELIPLVFMGATAQAPPSCAEQRPTKEASVTTASRTPEDLSLYRLQELEIFQARCEQELKAATDRGDYAAAQRWASLRATLIAEKQKRLEFLAQPAPNQSLSRTPQKTARRRRYHQPAPESAQQPTRESTSQPTPEEYPLPPGWPVGPKE
jgi:hypothetical protein